MFNELKHTIFNLITSRLTVMAFVFCILGSILIYRCFQLQIVQGEEYLNEFILQVEKTRDLPGTRGNIYDRNGNVLAYNELAYSVKVEDVFESGRTKNAKLNEMLYRLIKIIESNGDHVITDFKIVVDQNNEFAFTLEGSSLTRFLADVYDKKAISELSDAQKESTPLEIMQYLSRDSGKGFWFAIGEREDLNDSKSPFISGKGYTNQEWLQLVTIRYAMRQTAYRKYIGTTVATNVSENTVAVIMENIEDLPGVSIVEDTVRRYVDSQYFSHLLGYTGKISSEQLTQLNEESVKKGGIPDRYTLNDVVGKSGIEASMEEILQGTKGNEKVIVDIMGKVITILERTEPQSGDDLHLSIDKDLTIAIYNIIEQKLAGMLSSKIINAKEYYPGANSKNSDIKIPIYDVYYAIFNNEIVDISHFSAPDAMENERAVYEAYSVYTQTVYDRMKEELTEKCTPYKNLSKEYQVYQSNIVTLLLEHDILSASKIDSEDEMQISWTTEEDISLQEYLEYCIDQNWINVSKLEIEDKYSDATEIYDQLVQCIFHLIDHNVEFQKKFYKYMLLNNKITPRQACMLLSEQNVIEIPEDEEATLQNGRLSPYQFMKNRIENLDITPGQLALDPCNASVVVTDVNSGDVLAMVSYPGYDNNKMANSIDADYFAKLNSDKANTWWNFATQYKAAPGSTFKIVSAAAGLSENIVSLNQKINCTGIFTEVIPSPRCWKYSGHGNENITTAIRDSCNYYFYNIGYNLAMQSGSYNEQKGLDTLEKYADMFGLTEKSGVEIEEYAPTISDRDPVRSAIGQGRNSFTTTGLSRYVTAIANKGTCYQLTLLDKVTDSEGKILQEFKPKVRNHIDFPDEYWNVFHTGMKLAVQNKPYFDDVAVTVAGKTGTAEQSKSRPNHALFMCFAPYEAPEISVVTRIPFGYSSDYAAQLTRDVIKYYYGLEEKEEIITGTANQPEEGISNEM